MCRSPTNKDTRANTPTNEWPQRLLQIDLFLEVSLGVNIFDGDSILGGADLHWDLETMAWQIM